MLIYSLKVILNEFYSVIYSHFTYKILTLKNVVLIIFLNFIPCNINYKYDMKSMQKMYIEILKFNMINSYN